MYVGACMMVCLGVQEVACSKTKKTSFVSRHLGGKWVAGSARLPWAVG